jgi:hypothetical protein|tara:strand:+ start:555 stop:1205 length:651 start_codon:yes stop_codon:yes gene_type:complete
VTSAAIHKFLGLLRGSVAFQGRRERAGALAWKLTFAANARKNSERGGNRRVQKAEQFNNQTEVFVKYLMNSADAVFVVCRWLHLRGDNVAVSGVERIRGNKEHSKHSDGGDIATPTGIVEVKHLRNVEFTSNKDFPYPNAVAGFKYAIDNILPDLRAVVTLSKDLRHAYVVLPDMYKTATVMPVKNADGKIIKAYLVPAKKCHFFDIDAAPKWMEN